MKRFVLSVCLVLLAAFNAVAQEVKSPNGDVKVNFALNNSVINFHLSGRNCAQIKWLEGR